MSVLDLATLLRVAQVDTGLPFAVSPDGRKVAFAWNKTGTWEIYELDISARRFEDREARIVSGGEGAKFSPHYSPDGNRLAFALDPDGSEAYHIVLHNLEANARVAFHAGTTSAQQPNFAFSPDGQSLAVLSDERGQFALYLLSMKTGEKKLLLDIQRPIWDVTWSPDGKWIAVEAEMEASDRGIFVIDVEHGTWRQLELENRGLNAQQPAWSPDSKFLAFSAESGEWFDIGLYEVEANEISWLTEGTGDDTSPCWSVDGKRMAWLHSRGVVNRLVVYEEGQPIQQYQVATGIHHFPRFVSDNEILLVFESPRQPPDLWSLKLDGTFTQLTNSLPEELRAAPFRMPEAVSYESEGTSVPALLYRGDGECAVVNIHGGPNWHVQFLWDPLMAHMASRGWTVLAPNYRGSTGYGRTWQSASRFDMGGVDTRDCAAGVDYLVREGLATRFAATGRSHGGYLTMTCMTQFPELWCGGSAVVPFLNWFTSHENSREDLQHWNIENMGDPRDNYEKWYNHSPYFFLDRIRAPVQLICGGNDPRCPASDSRDAHDKLVELGKDVELLVYEEEGHSFLKIENLIDSEVRRVHFLAKVLKAQEP
jgi:dipeptidyl aminopeptidase/acylaminoacyl peptidase